MEFAATEISNRMKELISAHTNHPDMIRFVDHIAEQYEAVAIVPSYKADVDLTARAVLLAGMKAIVTDGRKQTLEMFGDWTTRIRYPGELKKIEKTYVDFEKIVFTIYLMGH